MRRRREREWSRRPSFISCWISRFHQRTGEGESRSSTERASTGAPQARYEATMLVPNDDGNDTNDDDDEDGDCGDGDDERRPRARICWWI